MSRHKVAYVTSLSWSFMSRLSWHPYSEPVASYLNSYTYWIEVMVAVYTGRLQRNRIYKAKTWSTVSTSRPTQQLDK